MSLFIDGENISGSMYHKVSSPFHGNWFSISRQYGNRRQNHTKFCLAFYFEIISNLQKSCKNKEWVHFTLYFPLYLVYLWWFLVVFVTNYTKA
jgi:hypothetical protein